jgi:[ribosomal protein S5]-alanine N-acetyltransferase
MDRVLRTERLVLRPVTTGDHAALLAHWTEPDVCRFLFDGAALSAAEVLEAIEDSTRDFGRSGYGLWLIYENHPADLAVVGPDPVRSGSDPAPAGPDPAPAGPGPAPAGSDPAPAGPGFVGTAGLRPLDELGLEVFYSLAPASWGKGYATEAARAVLDHALGSLGLPEVLAEVDAGNAASIAVIERLGMTPFAIAPGLLGPMTRYRKTR